MEIGSNKVLCRFYCLDLVFFPKVELSTVNWLTVDNSDLEFFRLISIGNWFLHSFMTILSFGLSFFPKVELSTVKLTVDNSDLEFFRLISIGNWF